MATLARCSPSVPSLPPPCPKSPPEYPDLYGKRRETAKVQMLEREIGFLEEELKSMDRIQPSSKCCKEIVDYVVAKPDPSVPTNRKNRRTCRFWKWLCGIPCFNCAWICRCCPSGCSIRLEMPHCYDWCSCKCNPCGCCPMPKLKCFSCPRFDCCKKKKRSCCRSSSCKFPTCSCANCFSCFKCKCKCRCKCSCPKCPELRPSCCCCSCIKSCCNPCTLCF